MVKNPPANAEDMRPRFNAMVGKIPWRRTWQPISVFLPGESHGWGSLPGYRSQSCKDLDMTDVTRHAWTCTQKVAESRLEARRTLVQYVRIRLPMQGTQVQSLVWEVSLGSGATTPMSHSY